MIDKNATKTGYKKTKLGWIPEEWEVIPFKDIVDEKIKWSLTGGPFGSDLKSEHYTDSGIRIIQLQNMGDGFFIEKGLVYTSVDKADELLGCNIYPNEIILSKMGDPVARACIIPRNREHRYLMSSDGIRVVPDRLRYDKYFVKEYINYSIFRNIAISHSTGSTRLRIGLKDLKKLPFPLFPLPEQQKIADILSTWDRGIQQLQALVEQLRLRKKGLMQQLLTGKKRLAGFRGAWEIVKGGTLFENYSNKKHDGSLEVLSATQDKGVIPRNQTGIDIKYDKASLKNYKKVEVGDYVISLRSFQGGIEYSYYEGLVSPAYTVLKEKMPIAKVFYKEYMKTQDFINRLNSIIYGIRDGKQISYKEFSSLKFWYPPLEEQRAIAAVLTQADQEIQHYETYLSSLQAQKKGLMQQLLTGQRRVQLE